MIFTERMLYRFIGAMILLSLFGCADSPEQQQQVQDQTRQLEIHHTGPVTVIDVAVSYCLPAEGGKSGTAVCDRSLTLETPSHRVSNMGLCRTGQWPPVWHGMKADIYFRLRTDSWDDSLPRTDPLYWAPVTSRTRGH